MNPVASRPNAVVLVSVLALILLGSFSLPGAAPLHASAAPRAMSADMAAPPALSPSAGPPGRAGVSLPLAAPYSPTAAATPPAQWTQLFPPSAPYLRGAPAFADSPQLNETLMYGGAGVNYIVDNDTWTYADGVYTNLTSSLTYAPPGLAGAMMTYDAADGYFLMFGGIEGYGGSSVSQTWVFAAGAWTNLTGTTGATPPDRYGGVLQYDPTAGYAVLWGGWTTGGSDLNDTWKYVGGSWTDISTQVGSGPAARGWASVHLRQSDRYGRALRRGAGRRALLFRRHVGVRGIGKHGDLEGHRGVRRTGAGYRRAASMAYDPSYGYDLLFGGDVYSSLSGSWSNYVDVWALNNGTWLNLTAAMTVVPPGRFDNILFFDPTSNALVLFGGCNSIGCFTGLNDTWRYEWNFSATLSESSTTVAVNKSISLSASSSGGPIAAYDTYSYGGLPPGCLSKNVTFLVCTPTTEGNYTPSFTATAVGGWNGSSAAATVTAYAARLRVVLPLTLASATSATVLDAGATIWIDSTAGGGTGGTRSPTPGSPPAAPVPT